MRKINLFLTIVLALSLIGCGKQVTDTIIETVSTVEDTKVSDKTETKAESENLVEEPEKTPEEESYTEDGDLYMLDGSGNFGTQVDMDSWDLVNKEYVVSQSINVYYTDTSLAGYTKDNAKISTALGNGEWYFCVFDKKGYLVKAEDLADAVPVGDEEETASNEPVEESAPIEPTVQPTVEEPTVEKPVVETPTVVESNKYTPDEAIAVYRSLMEAGGMTWNPSLKNGGSYGTGWIYLDKGQPEWCAATNLESAAMGDSAGNPCTDYYLEVTGSDENAVYIIEWSD